MFYNNLGHREDTWQNEQFLKSITGAVRWIAGTEEGSAVPNPEVSAKQHQHSIDESAKVGITPKAVEASEMARRKANEEKRAAKSAEEAGKKKDR